MLNKEVARKVQAARVLIDQGRTEGAITLVEDAVGLFLDNHFDLDTPRQTKILSDLAELYYSAGATEKEVALRESICRNARSYFTAHTFIFHEDYVEMAVSFLRLGRSYRRCNRCADAQSLFSEGAQLLNNRFATEPDLHELLLAEGPVLVGEYNGAKVYIT